MSPCQTAFMTRCIAGSSVGGPVAFRACTAGRAASLRKFLALPAGSCGAAAFAACASAITPATRPQMVASCAWRWALACFGPIPLRRGIVLRALQCAVSVGGQGANRCDKCATHVGSLRCTWIHRRAAPEGPA